MEISIKREYFSRGKVYLEIKRLVSYVFVMALEHKP